MIKDYLGYASYVHAGAVTRQWNDPFNIITIGGTKIVFSSVSVTTNTASASSATFPYYGYATVTFPTGTFTSAPKIICNIQRHAAYWNVSATAIDKNGFIARVAGDANNSSSTVQWLAIGT